MGRIVQSRAARGSQRWLQDFAATDRAMLDSAIGLGSLTWRSPLPEDGWAEYRDGDFLERLGVQLTRRPLDTFWPARGPVWDGLALTESGACVLVEAKAHTSELVSNCAAASASSRSRIRFALDETKRALCVDAGHDWCVGFYQYANRLAHAYLMNELNGVRTELVNLYFVGDSDMHGPTTEEQWKVAISEVHGALGLGEKLPAYVHEVFLDVTQKSAGAVVTEIETAFADEFSHWGIVLPAGAVETGTRGKITQAGWAIWYLYGLDERGAYLDYYAAHRMTNDRHVRLRPDGSREDLPAIWDFRVCSDDPEQDARLEDDYVAHNQSVATMLEEKGFGLQGDEPGGVQINRFLHLQGRDE